MPKYAAPVVPFVEARHVGTKQRPTAIVLSLSYTTSEKGAALGIASYHHSTTSPPVSHHYIVDEAEIYRCVPDNVSAYRRPHRSLSVLLCAYPDVVEPPYEVLTRTAGLVSDLLLIHKIPCRYLDEEMEKKWTDHRWRHRGGLIIRTEGRWPYEAFLNDVERKRP